MLSELHSLNLKSCSKQYNKFFNLDLIVVPQLNSVWWQLLNQNKAGGPGQCAVCVFSYVYAMEGKIGPTESTSLIF